MTTTSRAKIHRALKADGHVSGASRYDAEGYHLIDFVDYIGIMPGCVQGSMAADLQASLDRAGITYEIRNMRTLVPKRVEVSA